EVQAAPTELRSVGRKREPADVIRAGTPLGAELFGYAAHSEPGAGGLVGVEAVRKLVSALRNTFAFTIVDASSYTDHVLTALELSDRICLIATHEVAGLRHLERTLETLQALGLNRERLMFVLNRADGKLDPSDAEIQDVVKLRADARRP